MPLATETDAQGLITCSISAQLLESQWQVRSG